MPRSAFFFVTCVLMALAAVPTRAASSKPFQHDLFLRLHPDQGSVEGTDSIRLPEGQGRQVNFFLSPGAKIESVLQDGNKLPFRFKGGRLTVSLPSGENSSPVEIRYQARFNDPVPADPVNTEDPSYGVAAAVTPGGVFLGGGSGWYPEPEDSLSTFRLRVEGPADLISVTSGKRVDARKEQGKESSSWEIDYPVRGLALAAGPYTVGETKAGDIGVYTYFYPGSGQFAETYRQAAVRYLNLYRDRFGPYPFHKFAVAENFFPTGYGYPSWTLLGSTVVRLPFIVETSLGHEIAHSWWGNGVWVDYSRGNWSEGLTTYVADYLYKELKSPEEAKEYRLKILRDYAALVPEGKGIALKDFVSRSTAAEQTIGYGKSAMVFHMVRQRVGDEAFWKGLRQVAQTRMFDRASWSDFSRAMGSADDGQLDDFFNQWVNRAGAPVLSLEEVSREKTPTGWRVSGKVHQQSPTYNLRLQLRLETDGAPVETVLLSNSEVTPFSLESSSPPRRLSVDPEFNTFRRLDIAEIPATVNGIRGSSSLIAVASSQLPPSTLEASRMLLAAMGKENVPVVPEKKLSREDLKGRDILFLGLPKNRTLLPPLPLGLQVSAEASVLQGKAYKGGGSALFAALPHPQEPARVAALFLPGSPEAASLSARKIPHYGKYSYLAFVDGTNVEKGIWPVTESPLIHTFKEE